MYEFLQSGELKVQAKRLLGYRFPLVLVMLVNVVLLLRIPIHCARQARAQSPPSANATQPATAGAEVPAAASSTPSLDCPVSFPPESAGLSTVAPLEPPVADDTLPELTLPAEDDHDPHMTPLVSDPTPGAGSGAAVPPTGLLAEPMEELGYGVQRFVMRWRTSVRKLHDHILADRESLAAGDVAADHPPTEAVFERATVDSQEGQEVAEPRRPEVPGPVGLTVSNPLENEEVIRFLVNRRFCELHPGESHLFPPTDRWRIEFHPGGDFDDVQRIVGQGVYRFVPTPHGWDLMSAED